MCGATLVFLESLFLKMVSASLNSALRKAVIKCLERDPGFLLDKLFFLNPGPGILILTKLNSPLFQPG